MGPFDEFYWKQVGLSRSLSGVGYCEMCWYQMGWGRLVSDVGIANCAGTKWVRAVR
jgi:hypothetical protein